MGQIGLTVKVGALMEVHDGDDIQFPEKLWGEYGSKVLNALRKMGPEARGRIAACGTSVETRGSVSHWDVNRWRDISGYHSGDNALTLLASYVVVAAIVDIVRAQVEKDRGEERASDEQFDRGMRDYVHSGPKATGSSIPHSSRYTAR
jgi:hypothetical protein